MQKYQDYKGNSGVVAYETGPDWIRVKFKSGDVYTYSYKSAGQKHIEEMKDLARKGRGLATYITKHVRDFYE